MLKFHGESHFAGADPQLKAWSVDVARKARRAGQKDTKGFLRQLGNGLSVVEVQWLIQRFETEAGEEWNGWAE